MGHRLAAAALAVGLAFLVENAPALASCAGRLQCTEFTDPPTRQEVVVTPAKPLAKPPERRARAKRYHRHHNRTAIVQGGKKHQEPAAPSPAKPPPATEAGIAATAVRTVRVIREQPRPQPPAQSRPQPPAAAEPDSASAVVADGFKVVAASPSDNSPQQALLAERYLATRASAPPHQAASSQPAEPEPTVARASPDPTRGTAQADSPAAPASVLLNLAAALAGLSSIALAFTVLS